jgi:hypothetical protein
MWGHLCWEGKWYDSKGNSFKRKPYFLQVRVWLPLIISAFLHGWWHPFYFISLKVKFSPRECGHQRRKERLWHLYQGQPPYFPLLALSSWIKKG